MSVTEQQRRQKATNRPILRCVLADVAITLPGVDKIRPLGGDADAFGEIDARDSYALTKPL
jgi:hypothetical protein